MASINIENFKGLKIKIEFEGTLKEQAKKCCDDIIKNSMSKGWENYAKGWTVKTKKDKGVDYYVVLNKSDYRLTHLLENGHLIVNKKNGVGYSAPRVHIKPAFDSIKNSIAKKVAENLKIEIK